MTNPTIRVLCVDDHRLMREGVAKIVGVQPDMEVVAEASNGEQAVAQFQACRPDVTLMDLQLPVASGPEAIKRIMQIDPSARIIALTMYRGDEDIHRAFDAGAMGYVLKDTISDDRMPARAPGPGARGRRDAQQGDRSSPWHQRRHDRHARQEHLHEAARARPHRRRRKSDPPRHHPHRVDRVE